MKILFMGTPDIAASCLAALLADGQQVVAVVTQADRPRGRGYTLTPPPVKVLATERGIPVYQPATLRDEAFAKTLSEIDPDLIAVVAYGKILPVSVLSYPKYGCINVHASLLPKYRGAAPIQRAIMDGETVTGITTMYMEEGLDTGDMLLTEEIAISKTDDFGSIHDRMAEVGGRLLCETVRALENGTAVRRKQDDAAATYASKIEKADCHLDLTKSAQALDPYIRGLSPIPLSFVRCPDGKMLKIVRAEAAEGRGAPGEILALDDRGEGGILVACGEGALLLREIVPEGKGKMRAADFIRGRRLQIGEVLV
jgi:methionyl-tRNA formyltransferase